jgi:hypothetical protein
MKMKLEQAIETIDRLVLQIPDESFPDEDDWIPIEEAIATLQDAVASGSTGVYKKGMVIELISTARMTLGLARAGGSKAIATVLADERISVTNWLEMVMS